jgi:hypothetical protein
VTSLVYTLQEVVSFPQPLTEGVLYFSSRFAVSAHKCACGCGNDVILAVNPAQWQLTRHHDGTASLRPSIDNSSFPCRSHYWIRSGKVDWYAPLTDEEVQEARARDRRARSAYYQQLSTPVGLLGRLRTWLNKVLKLPF